MTPPPTTGPRSPAGSRTVFVARLIRASRVNQVEGCSPSFGFDAAGVGHDEEPFAPVRGADFLRREQARRNSVAHRLQVVGDGLESQRQMAGDVLEETDAGLDFVDDPADGGPVVAGSAWPSRIPAVLKGRRGYQPATQSTTRQGQSSKNRTSDETIA
jgi:hypothetical protein